MFLAVLSALATVALSDVFRTPITIHHWPNMGSGERNLMDLLRSRRNESQPFVVEYSSYELEWYLIDVSLGTPAQNFTLLFDTGSADLWVMDVSCSAEGCPPHPQKDFVRRYFNSSKSETYENNGRELVLGYGAGLVQGFLGSDTFEFAGIIVENQTFTQANNLTGLVPETPFDGILGADWPEVAFSGATPPINNALSQWDKPIFTVWLDQRRKLKAGTGDGLITYGGLDNENCEKKWKFVATEGKRFWSVSVDGIKYGDETADGGVFMLDMGTPIMTVPQNLLDEILKDANHTNANGTDLVDCDKIKTLKDIHFTIGGVPHAVHPYTYVIDPNREDKKCVLLIDSTSQGGPILGSPFSRSLCIAYDVGKARVGFSKAIHS